MVRYVKDHWITLFFGVILGTIGILLAPGLMDIGADGYDQLRPVIKDWKVDSTFTDGADIVLHGTMVKQRDCTFLPSLMARDEAGQGYTVSVGNPERVLDAIPTPQRWGPWRVHGGAGKRLTYTIVYVCGSGSRPVITEVGTYPK